MEARPGFVKVRIPRAVRSGGRTPEYISVRSHLSEEAQWPNVTETTLENRQPGYLIVATYMIVAMPSWRMLFMHAVCFGFAFCLGERGQSMLARMAIMAITTNSSINVKPLLREFWNLRRGSKSYSSVVDMNSQYSAE